MDSCTLEARTMRRIWQGTGCSWCTCVPQKKFLCQARLLSNTVEPRCASRSCCLSKTGINDWWNDPIFDTHYRRQKCTSAAERLRWPRKQRHLSPLARWIHFQYEPWQLARHRLLPSFVHTRLLARCLWFEAPRNDQVNRTWYTLRLILPFEHQDKSQQTLTLWCSDPCRAIERCWFLRWSQWGLRSSIDDSE